MLSLVTISVTYGIAVLRSGVLWSVEAVAVHVVSSVNLPWTTTLVEPLQSRHHQCP